METQARYALIGVFTLAVIAAAFAFVYWLENTGGLRERTTYAIAFDTPVPGLQTGAAVLFNGIRVGEVTALAIDGEDPRRVTAQIAVDSLTPLRADTHVGIAYQGLTGGAVVSLTGGSASAPPLKAEPGHLPLLVADPAAVQDWTQAARDVLQHISGILADNEAPLHSAISNIQTFTDVLARNSDRIDGILIGLERMTGGATPKTPPPIFDLAAASDIGRFDRPLKGQLLIPDPSVVLAFNTDKILIEPRAGESMPLPDAQWSDNLPNLFQAKVIQSFENAGFIGSVGRRMDNFEPAHQLVLDIRRFHLVTTPQAAAEVAFSAKILGTEGRILAARLFSARTPADSAEPEAAAAALSKAFVSTMAELIPWTYRTLEAAAEEAAPQETAPAAQP